MNEPGQGPEQQAEIPPAADVLLSTVHLLVTVGFERTGLRPGSTRDLGEVELSVESVRALLPLLERLLPPDVFNQYRQALSELQMAYAEAVRSAPEGAPPAQGQAPAQEQERPRQPPPVDTPPRPKIWTPRGDV
ncbi:MAG: hypothetical protein ACTHNU_02695 [Gaiellales bacterium]